MGIVESKYLIELAKDRSAAGRKKLGEALSELFLQKGEALTDRELALMFDVLRHVLHDMEMSVRRVVAAHLASAESAPPDLCKALSNDDIEVAFPLLVQSLVLSDEDLIEVVRNRTLEHQLAVSIRQSVSENVSDALVEQGNEHVIHSLLNNKRARISRSTMEHLVEESKRVDTFQEPILRRDDLDPQLAKRMYMWVSAALRRYILERYDVDKTFADNLLERSALDHSTASSVVSSHPTKTDELANEIVVNTHKGAAFLVNALRAGDVPLFISIFQRLTGLRKNVVRRILFEPSGESLTIACRAIGLDDESFWQVYDLSRLARKKTAVGRKGNRRQVMERFKSLSSATAQEVIASWGRDVDYLNAIRHLESVDSSYG